MSDFNPGWSGCRCCCQASSHSALESLPLPKRGPASSLYLNSRASLKPSRGPPVLFLACLLPHEGMSPSMLMPKQVCLHIERRLQSPQDTSGCVNVLVGKVQALSQASQLPKHFTGVSLQLEGHVLQRSFSFCRFECLCDTQGAPCLLILNMCCKVVDVASFGGIGSEAS